MGWPSLPDRIASWLPASETFHVVIRGDPVSRATIEAPPGQRAFAVFAGHLELQHIAIRVCLASQPSPIAI